jgi:hypothetical protein
MLDFPLLTYQLGLRDGFDAGPWTIAWGEGLRENQSGHVGLSRCRGAWAD